MTGGEEMFWSTEEENDLGKLLNIRTEWRRLENGVPGRVKRA